MNSSLAVSWLVAVAFWMPVASTQTISIRVLNRAQVSAANLNAALLETTRLFKPASVRIAWQFNIESPEDAGIDMSSPTAHRTDTRPYLVLSLITGTPGTIYPGALGFALPFAHAGAHASVFYDRIETITRTQSTPQYVILGDAIAHELGHVLLGSKEHSAAGLLQARWNRAAWRLASEGLLGFLPKQLEPMRRTALAIGSRDRLLISTEIPNPAAP